MKAVGLAVLNRIVAAKSELHRFRKTSAPVAICVRNVLEMCRKKASESVLFIVSASVYAPPALFRVSLPYVFEMCRPTKYKIAIFSGLHGCRLRPLGDGYADPGDHLHVFDRSVHRAQGCGDSRLG